GLRTFPVDGVPALCSPVLPAVQGVLERGGIDPAEVVFISHGTTQATNALLEGDVVPVGIVGMGSGLDGARARNQTQIEPIPLAQGRSSSRSIPSSTRATGSPPSR